MTAKAPGPVNTVSNNHSAITDGDLDRAAADVDPISEAQRAVWEAKALLQCVDAAMQPGVCAYSDLDLTAAMAGVIRILDKVGDDLDPIGFRRAIVASQEVAHG